MRSLFARGAETAPEIAPEADAPRGWDALRGNAKLAAMGVGALAVVGAVVGPGLFKPAPVQQLANQEPRPPSRINEYEAPPSGQEPPEKVLARLGAGPSPPPAPKRRPAVVPTEMALYAAPSHAAPSHAAAATRAAPDGADGVQSAAAGGGGGGEPEDRLAAHVGGATALPTSRATPVRNADFLIRAGETIPCLPIDAQNSGRPGFTSCRVPEWFRGSNQRRGLLPPGTRIFGQIRNGVAQGEVRLGVLYTRIQTPRFDVTLAAPGADAMGRAGLDGDVQTFFWDRAGAVALYALLDAAIGAGQAAGSAALSRAVGGGNGTVLNFGSIGGQAQGLASQEMAHRLNRPPVVTRDQALPMTVTVGQDLDFSAACKQAMQVDPMACPLL